MVQYLCVHDQYEYDRKALAQWLYVTKRQKKEIKGYIKKYKQNLQKDTLSLTHYRISNINYSRRWK